MPCMIARSDQSMTGLRAANPLLMADSAMLADFPFLIRAKFRMGDDPLGMRRGKPRPRMARLNEAAERRTLL